MAGVESGTSYTTETMEAGQLPGDNTRESGESSNPGQSQNAGTGNSIQGHLQGDGGSAQSPDTVAGTNAQTQPIVGMDKESGQGDSTAISPEPIDYEAAAANGYRIYTVNAGETLYGICWSHYASLDHLAEICSLNNLTDVDRILAGQKLILP